LIDSAFGLSLFGAFVFTVGSTAVYILLAHYFGIVATPNFRSLHEKAIPRGGGIVFSLICLTVLTVLWRSGSIDAHLARTLVIGGLVAAASGFVDDVMQLRVFVKLLIQAALAAWILASNGGQAIYDVPLAPPWLDLAVSWFGLIWLFNLYNFIDGIDGLASCAAILISALATFAVMQGQADQSVLAVLAVIVVSTLGFIPFNWPPARLFMGDSGSLFLGFCFGSLLASTVSSREIDLLVWVIILAFVAGDTTTTTVLRIFLTDKWYGAHRSHAYQNLARMHGHRRVLNGVVLYHVAWLLPMLIIALRWPSMRMVIAVLALVPVILWTIRYGPRLSSS
jgi:Fuc2NAc and GlcNAc transferase